LLGENTQSGSVWGNVTDEAVSICGYLFNINLDEFTLLVEDAQKSYSGVARQNASGNK
jgi:hypothetical protein